MKKTYALFQNFPQLELEHYTLRKVEHSDYDDLYNIYSDQETVLYEGIEPHTTEEHTKAFISTILSGYDNKYFIRWVIERKDNKQVIGLVAIHHIDYKNYSSQIGYILNKRYWRQNIMFQVLTGFIKYIFINTEIHRLEASIHPDNIPSIQLSKKLGFEIEGIKKHGAYNQLTQSFEDRIILGLIQ